MKKTNFRRSSRHLASTALGSLAALALAACGSEGGGPAESPVERAESAETKAPELGSFGIELEDMKPEVAPGDDFFAYVNGAWLDTFEIPEERSSFSSFTRLAERAEENIRTIIEEAASGDTEPGSLEQKIGDTFKSFMDTEAIEAAGLDPIQDELDGYRSIETMEDLAAVLTDPSLAAGGPVSAGVSIDAKFPDRYTVYMSQSGLGLPTRDYYLEEKFADKAVAYEAFLAQMLTFAGEENAEERAAAVYAMEKRIAEVHWDRAKSRNRDLTYNPYTLETLEAEMPGLPWRLIVQGLGVSEDQEFIVRQPDAIQGIAAIFAETPMAVIQDHLIAHAISSYSSVLPNEIDDADFAFYGTELRGTPAQRERWKRGVSVVNGALGEAVGQVYVDKHFPIDSKTKMDALVKNLRVAFAERLEGLDWMTEATKEEAYAKLDAFTPKIGYPDVWTDYSKLEVIAGDPVGNMRRVRVFRFEDNFGKLGQPIDKTEWFMTPQTVNAYYNPTANEIVFPAAILQAPFFDPNADPAVNYGGIGAVIGHEIGHGFDDQGRKSDGTGALRDWWQPEDAEAFEAKAAKLGAQYAAYEPIAGSFINPALTMGENIGDLGGLTMAYAAYRLSLGGEEAPVIDGYTGDQRFFMAWAQVWKVLYRDDALRNRIATDSHSPGEYRTNGVVRNMDAWYTAFEVTEENELYLPPEERVSIW